MRISGVVEASRRLAQGRTAKSSSAETEAKTTTWAQAGAPRAEAPAAPSAPPAIMRKVSSAVRVSMTMRTRAPASHSSHPMGYLLIRVGGKRKTVGGSRAPVEPSGP